MAEKLFYSMGEVTEMLDVKPSLVRFWGTKFTCLRPKRNNKGNRMFSPEDVANLKLIYHLVKEKNMTLEGAAKAMKAERIAAAGQQTSGRIAAIEKLQVLRSQLLAIRDSLGTDPDDVIEEIVSAPDTPSAVGSMAEEEVAPAAADVSADGSSETGGEEPASDEGNEKKPRSTRRRNQRKPVEQSLFKDPELF